MASTRIKYQFLQVKTYLIGGHSTLDTICVRGHCNYSKLFELFVVVW